MYLPGTDEWATVHTSVFAGIKDTVIITIVPYYVYTGTNGPTHITLKALLMHFLYYAVWISRNICSLAVGAGKVVEKCFYCT